MVVFKYFFYIFLSCSVLGCVGVNTAVKEEIVDQKPLNQFQKNLLEKLEQKIAQRKTINTFLAWNPDKPQSRYGLAWAKYIKPSKHTITLNEVYWNYHYVGNPWHHYPGIEKFLTDRDWDHDAEYGKTLATKIIDPDYPNFVVSVAKGKLASDRSNGIMFDWWHNYHSSGYTETQVQSARKNIALELRKFLGPGGIILVNSSWVKDRATTRYINGVFLELSKTPYDNSSHRLYRPSELKKMEDMLEYYEKNLAYPKLVALEGWRKTENLSDSDRNSKENRKMAKLMTAMSVVVNSNGYILYADNNNDTPNGDHDHFYYDFYSFDIGKPSGPMIEASSGVRYKEHQKGLIAYNISSRSRSFKRNNGTVVEIAPYSGLFCSDTSTGLNCLPYD